MHFIGIYQEDHSSPGLVSPFKGNGDLLSYLVRNPKVDRIDMGSIIPLFLFLFLLFVFLLLTRFLALAQMEQVCSGLEYLHGNKPEVVHGDLKCV